MSTMFIFVLAMLAGPNEVMGEDVVFLKTFDTMSHCEKFLEESEPPKDMKLACLAIAKPGMYKDNEEI